VLVTRYVALLRGINVGGKNLIRMTDLLARFEEHGFEDVSTYIQSGNVLFRTGSRGDARSDDGALTARIEQMLAGAFAYPGTVTLRSHSQMRSVVEEAPGGFGTEPDRYRYDVIFLLPPLTAEAAMRSVGVKDGVDQAHPGNGVLYFSRLIERATQSRLSRLMGTPDYQRMTIRNWKTTTKLLELMTATD